MKSITYVRARPLALFVLACCTPQSIQQSAPLAATASIPCTAAEKAVLLVCDANGPRLRITSHIQGMIENAGLRRISFDDRARAALSKWLEERDGRIILRFLEMSIAGKRIFAPAIQDGLDSCAREPESCPHSHRIWSEFPTHAAALAAQVGSWYREQRFGETVCETDYISVTEIPLARLERWPFEPEQDLQRFYAEDGMALLATAWPFCADSR